MTTIHMYIQSDLSDTIKKISKYPADDILHTKAQPALLPKVTELPHELLVNLQPLYGILRHWTPI